MPLRPRTPSLVISVLAAAVLATACSSAGGESGNKASTSPSGGTSLTAKPIKLMVATTLSGIGEFAEVPAAAKAAAKAVNDSGGVAGHPIEIIPCDTQLTPNGAGACARKAVSEQVTALVGTADPNGDTYQPILEKAGIPSVANNPSSQADITSKLSFPIQGQALQFVAAAGIIKGTGGTSIHYLGPDIPAFSGLMQLVKGLLPATGVKFNGMTLYPPTTTDFTQYVTKAYSSGASGVDVILGTPGSIPAFVNAVTNGGYDLKKTPTVLYGTTFRPSDLKGPLADKMDGAYIVNAGQTPTDTTLAGIKTFHDEVAASGEKVEFNDNALEAWVGVHLVAQLLANAQGDVTSPAVLIKALQATGQLDLPGWTPVDFSKPALPAPLSKIFARYFNDTVWVSRIVGNDMVSAVNKAVVYTGPFELTK